MTAEQAYAKSCNSAAMIGYEQTMIPDEILKEVNQFAAGRGVPPLTLDPATPV
jgi:hypothetical protein